MSYETYRAQSKKLYYVPDRIRGTKQLVDFLTELSREKKIRRDDWDITDVWVKGDDLYFEKVGGAKKKLAIFRK